jgi:hypothetical protein
MRYMEGLGLTRNQEKFGLNSHLSGEEKFGLHNIWANKIRGSGFSGLLFSGQIMFLIFGTKIFETILATYFRVK